MSNNARVEVIVMDKISLIGDGASALIRTEAGKTLRAWQRIHPLAEVVSAIPAMANSYDNCILTITLLYRERASEEVREPIKKFRPKEAHGCDDDCASEAL